MKKVLFILIIIAIGGASYFAARVDTEKMEEIEGTQYATFKKSELGIEFDYEAGPLGYVLEEVASEDAEAHFKGMIVLLRTEDTLREIPLGGEAPPVIAIYVFSNLEKQQPQTWAEANTQYSNINLKMSDVVQTSVGGENAIRYTADGLYASENAVVAHGDSIYVMVGQFMDKDSDIRRDFESLLESVRFVEKQAQE